MTTKLSNDKEYDSDNLTGELVSYLRFIQRLEELTNTQALLRRKEQAILIV